MKLTHSIGKNGKPYTAITNTLPNGNTVYDFDKTKVRLALHLAQAYGLLDELMLQSEIKHACQLLLIQSEWAVDFDKI